MKMHSRLRGALRLDGGHSRNGSKLMARVHGGYPWQAVSMFAHRACQALVYRQVTINFTDLYIFDHISFMVIWSFLASSKRKNRMRHSRRHNHRRNRSKSEYAYQWSISLFVSSHCCELRARLGSTSCAGGSSAGDLAELAAHAADSSMSRTSGIAIWKKSLKDRRKLSGKLSL